MMRMYDIILQKRGGGKLSDEQLRFVTQGVAADTLPDYQVSALLMAIWFNGMDAEETARLTHHMAHSGDLVDLSSIPGVKVDKHSTGGVGDKTSLVVGPIVAACGVPVAKMSGRGLGHTGGTIDKLEAIPGMRTAMEKEEFFRIVRTVGIAMTGQTGNIAPADKKLYALRDVTATVDSLPLIASSIMSKKLAAGADAIVLDVKTGSGAFMKTLDGSIALARCMVEIGRHVGKEMAALVTDMDVPLGNAVGNALEVAEAARTLRGCGPSDLAEISLLLAAEMLALAGKGPLDRCLELARRAIAEGAAFDKLCEMVRAQGGQVDVLDDPARFGRAPVIHPVHAPRAGYITHMQTEAVGAASVILGAGRARKEDPVDPLAGLVLLRKTGDRVEQGDVLAELHTARAGMAEEAAARLLQAVAIGDAPPPKAPLAYARVTPDAVELLQDGARAD